MKSASKNEPEYSLEESRNYATVREFFDYLHYERNVSDVRLTNMRRLLSRFDAFHKGKLFGEIAKQDVLKFLLRNKKSDEQDPRHKWIGSYNGELIDLTTFFYWLYNKGKDESEWVKPSCVRIKPIKRVEQSPYSQSDLWTEEEVLFASTLCDSTRDAFIITATYELAAIPKDIVNIRIGHVMLNEKYAQITISAKGRERTNPIVLSYSYLRSLLNDHPFKNNKDAYLVISTQTYKKIGARHIWYILKHLRNKLDAMFNHKQLGETELKIAEQLFKKPWNPYILRHSSLTSKGDFLNDNSLKIIAGWSANTRVPKRYLHKRDAIKPILQHYGIVEEEGKKVVKQNVCSKCQFINSPKAKYCEKCSFILSPEAWEEVKKEENSMKASIELLTKNQDVITKTQEAIIAALKSQGLQINDMEEIPNVVKKSLHNLVSLNIKHQQDLYSKYVALKRKLYQEQGKTCQYDDLELMFDLDEEVIVDDSSNNKEE